MRPSKPRASCLPVSREISGPQAYPQKHVGFGSSVLISSTRTTFSSTSRLVGIVRVDGLHVNVRVRLARLAPKWDRFRASCVSHVLGHAKPILFHVYGRHSVGGIYVPALLPRWFPVFILPLHYEVTFKLLPHRPL